MKLLKTALLTLLVSFAFAQEKMVKANGTHFHVFTKGLENRDPKKPVIVFENGMGVGLGNWDTVLDDLAKLAPVLAYDRAGVEKSDKIYQMPTVARTSGNLKAILEVLNIAPPYVIVGHSMGGLYARAFAGFYPDEIAGLVLIDPADFTETKEDWNNIFRKLSIPEKKIDEMLYNRLYKPQLPPTQVDSMYYGPWSEAQVLGALRRTDFAEVKALPLPDVPVYFFMAGKFEVPPELRSKDFDQEAFFQVRTLVNMERWRKFIYSSRKGGSLIYLSNSGHFIHRDDAKAVTANIRLLLESLVK